MVLLADNVYSTEKASPQTQLYMSVKRLLSLRFQRKLLTLFHFIQFVDQCLDLLFSDRSGCK